MMIKKIKQDNHNEKQTKKKQNISKERKKKIKIRNNRQKINSDNRQSKGRIKVKNDTDRLMAGPGRKGQEGKTRQKRTTRKRRY